MRWCFFLSKNFLFTTYKFFPTFEPTCITFIQDSPFTPSIFPVTRNGTKQINCRLPDRYFRMKLSHIGSDVRVYVIDGKRELNQGVGGWKWVKQGAMPRIVREAGSRTLHGIHSDFPPAWPPFPRQPILKLSQQTGQLEGMAPKRI